MAVWCWLESIPDSPYSLPYTTQSPVDYKPKQFKSVEDIWNEIELLEKENTKWTSGQNLYHIVPLFAPINLLLEGWMWDAIQEYQYQQWTHLGELDSASAQRLDYFNIIEKEIKASQTKNSTSK